MTSEEGGRRAKRRCARNKYTSSAAMPSAIHYVGYVEDDETPEMIMAKFAELERIQAAGITAKTAQVAAADVAVSSGGEEQGPVSDQQQPEDDSQQPQQPAQQQGDPAVPSTSAATQQGQQQEQQQQCAQPPLETGSEEGGLTDEQLLQVFKQTSMFNVRTALADNQMLMGIDEILEATNERYADEEEVSDDEDMLRTFWSDEDDTQWGDSGEEDESGRRSRSRRARLPRAGSRGSGLHRGAAGSKARHNVITAFNPVTQALVRRKVRVGASERDEITHLRVPPPPIPVSWGRTVAPYVPAHLRGEREMAVPVPPALLKAMREGGRAMHIEAMERSTYREERSIPQADWNGLLACRGSSGASASSSSSSSGGYQAVLINPGWECEGRGDAAVQRLAKLPMRRLVPKGFVFVYVQKQHVQALCRQMRAWGYCYIENLTWVYLRPNNQVLALPSRYTNSSHLTLYMFRREGEGKDIELRHQRNPDVTFDCLVSPGGGRRAVPDETFVAVETLLPTGKGSFLELWAPLGVRRPGWTHVVEVGAPES